MNCSIILKPLWHSLDGLDQGQHFGSEFFGSFLKEGLVIIDLVPIESTPEYFRSGLFLKCKVVRRDRGEYDQFRAWKAAYTAETQCKQLHPVIVHPLGGVISLATLPEQVMMGIESGTLTSSDISSGAKSERSDSTREFTTWETLSSLHTELSTLSSC